MAIPITAFAILVGILGFILGSYWQERIQNRRRNAIIQDVVAGAENVAEMQSKLKDQYANAGIGGVLVADPKAKS